MQPRELRTQTTVLRGGDGPRPRQRLRFIHHLHQSVKQPGREQVVKKHLLKKHTQEYPKDTPLNTGSPGHWVENANIAHNSSHFPTRFRYKPSPLQYQWEPRTSTRHEAPCLTRGAFQGRREGSLLLKQVLLGGLTAMSLQFVPFCATTRTLMPSPG